MPDMNNGKWEDWIGNINKAFMSIYDHFSHLSLSLCQEEALSKLEVFLNSPTPVFMLTGYAGGGKTTVLKGLVEYLTAIEKDFVLMAPIGRVAKIIRERTGQEAYTIHKTIYSYHDMVEVEEDNSFYYYYKIRNNIDAAGRVYI